MFNDLDSKTKLDQELSKRAAIIAASKVLLAKKENIPSVFTLPEADDKADPLAGLRARTHTFSLERLSAEPTAKPCLMGRFPIGCTTAVAAMGGAGKTSWLVLQALEAAMEGHHTVIVSAEDDETDYQAKIYNAIFSHNLFNDAYHQYDANKVAGCIHVLNLKGDGAKMIRDAGGSFVPSTLSLDLAKLIQADYPAARLVIFETVSRFAGGEDNDRMEALVSACDGVAIKTCAACVVVHHVGKAQSRDKIIDLYSGRGGSALGDNTRSFFVLTRLDSNYLGETPPKTDQDDIDAGRVCEVTHVRYSYGPTVPPEYFATRHGACFGPVLERLEVATEDDKRTARRERIKAVWGNAENELFDEIKRQGGKVPKKHFEGKGAGIISLAQKPLRALIQDLIDNGHLFEVERKVASGQKAKYITTIKPCQV